VICLYYQTPTHLYLALYYIFLGHVYVVVSPKGNGWGTNYWLTQCIKVKQTINTLVTDDEYIEYMVGLMFLRVNTLH